MQSNSLSATGIWVVGKHGFAITFAHDHPLCDNMLTVTGRVNQDTSHNKNCKTHTMILFRKATMVGFVGFANLDTSR